MKAVRMFFATVVALFSVMAATVAVSAEPAFISLSMDRAIIAAGESVTFTVRATPQTTHVFASVEGLHVPAIRGAGNNWTVTVSPVRTTTASIFANDSNEEIGAAEIQVPITVGGVGGVGLPAQLPGEAPPVPADLGPLAIHHIRETPPNRRGWIQLTVITGREVGEVWANFDRENNVRATGRFARGTRVSEDGNSITWVINFDPTRFVSQTLEIGANRYYRWEGATTQHYTLTLAQQYGATGTAARVAAGTGTLRINSATPNPRTPRVGRQVTISIATSHNVEYVWVRDPGGREFNATRTNSTQAAQNWSVTFTPNREGAHVVHANNINAEDGAVTRTVRIGEGRDGNVGDGRARIIGTPTATWFDRDSTRIRVTTNADTQTVWAIMPGDTRRIQLHRTNTGSGDRIWQTETFDNRRSGDIRIGVSSFSGRINDLDADDTRTIRRSEWDDRWWDDRWWDDRWRDDRWRGEIISTSLWRGHRTVFVGDHAEFLVVTTSAVTSLDVVGGSVRRQDVSATRSTARGGEQEWWVGVQINQGRGPLNLHVNAYVGGSRVDSRSLPSITVE